MRANILRRAVVTALVATALSFSTGCDQTPSRPLSVVVIGESLRVAEPSDKSMTRPQAVLLANTAQGLVRFDARGQIEPGLAETWNVSDDGRSYIFRLANTTWSNGRKVTAERVARLLRQQIATSSDNPLKESLTAIDEIVPMTERVLEIRLKSPTPQLLQLLAQPQMALLSGGGGTGPFELEREDDAVMLTRTVPTPDEEEARTEQLRLAAATAEEAVQLFATGEADLVIGGTFVDLPLVRQAELPARALQFDPVSGLFGLLPLATSGSLGRAEVRQILSQGIDREALISALGVPALVPRATVLEPGLTNIPDPVPPEWTAAALAERRPQLIAAAQNMFGGNDSRPVVRVALPEGPGADIVLDRLRQDWGALGLDVERASRGNAHFALIDESAPSAAADWFLRKFSCNNAKVCDEELDQLLSSAETPADEAQRRPLMLTASQRIDELALFIPFTAPIRWSLVSSRVTGFAGNRFARHTLTGLEQTLRRQE